MIAELSRAVKNLVNYASKKFWLCPYVRPSVRTVVRTNVPYIHVTENEMPHLLAWRNLQYALNLILDSHVMVMQLTSVKKRFR